MEMNVYVSDCMTDMYGQTYYMCTVEHLELALFNKTTLIRLVLRVKNIQYFPDSPYQVNSFALHASCMQNRNV